MKKIIGLFLFFLVTNAVAQQTNLLEKPRVDERVELLSIVFRLAETQAYTSNHFKMYVDDIHRFYAPYKNHELIQFVSKTREKHGVAVDRIMNMAVHVDKQFNPLIPFGESNPEIIWKDNDAEFVRLLKRFYEDTDSESFFKSKENLYSEVSERFLSVYESLDLSWYQSFYGKEPNEEFIIINGLGNGGSNYGIAFHSPGKNKRTVYAIMGTWQMDSVGFPDFSVKAYLPTLLHEFNHSFINYLLDRNPAPFKQSGETIYQEVRQKMNTAFYHSWQTMFSEALVRACVIKYMKDHNYAEEEVNNEIFEQINRGFIWIEDLVAELEKYSQQSEFYPTLESYFPNFVKAYDRFAANIDAYADKYLGAIPQFLSFTELKNGDQDVDPSTKQLTINFDGPFREGHFFGPISGTKFPAISNMTYANGGKSVVLEWTLEPNTEYAFVLMGLSPNPSADGERKDYVVHFKTR